MSLHSTTSKSETEQLAERIADRIFPKIWDRDVRDKLAKLLVEFAAEIKRSAIEP